MNEPNYIILIINNSFIKTMDISNTLSALPYTIKVVPDQNSAIEFLNNHPVTLVITEATLTPPNRNHIIRIIKTINPFIGIICFCPKATIADAVNTIKDGADYFFSSDFETQSLIDKIHELIDETTSKSELLPVINAQSKHISNGIVHVDEKMHAIVSSINQIAQTKATVLILGESGVGKEVFAKMIHQKSLRKHKRFVVVNCAAIPEYLIESELFGHERGSFTGAHYKKIGKFEQAQGGTIFLDEMGELSLNMQVKFLRVLQEKQLERVGSSDSIEIDVRIIAATNRVLHKELEAGKFREDLYYRLNVINFFIPPLRERKKDIPLMAQIFLSEFSKEYNKQLEFMDIEVMHTLINQTWKGNVRELRNVIERATVVAKRNETILMMHHLPIEIVKSNSHNPGHAKTELTLKEYEKMIISYTLNSVNGNKRRTAEILDINRQTLYNKLNEYGLL
jgi:two-component system response regulator AtoC